MSNYIFISKNIFDGLSQNTFSGAVVFEGKHITAICKIADEIKSYISSSSKLYDFGDKLIMPGFIDSHVHMGSFMDCLDPSYCIDISSAKTLDQAIALLSKFHSNNPTKTIYGINYNIYQFGEDAFMLDAQVLDKYFLDAPVVVSTFDLHTWFTNSKLMEMANIDRNTPDPLNGILKDAAGNPLGIFNDTACHVFNQFIQRPLMERLPSFKHFESELNRYGITAVGEVWPFGVEEPYPLFKKLEDDGSLTTRIVFYPPLMSATDDSVEQYKAMYNTDMLHYGGLKCVLDGVTTMHTAWMKDDYKDAPGNCGFPIENIDEVHKRILHFHSTGNSIRVHTIGDRSISTVLDYFEEAEKKYGMIKKHHVMEHLEYVPDEDLSRISKLNVVGAMQGQHITFDSLYVNAVLTAEVEKRAFRWRDLLDAGTTIGNGSDYVVAHFNPFSSIYAVMTRKTAEGLPENGWLPDQCITLAEALKSYTFGSACVLNMEEKIGSLKEGMLADIVVIDRNLFDCKPEDILTAMPIITVVDGKIVKESKND